MEKIGGRSMKESMVTMDEIESAWGDADFGPWGKREVVKGSLLNRASGYYTCHTATKMLIKLNLLTPTTNKLTKRGMYCLYEFFKFGISV